MRPALVLLAAVLAAACASPAPAPADPAADAAPPATAGATPYVVDGAPLAPLVFDAFLPGLESGAPAATAVALDTVTAPGALTDEGWYRTDRGGGRGWVEYRHLGESGGRPVFLVRENGGGTLSRAGLVVVGFDGGTARRAGYADVANLRDFPVALDGDTLRYDGRATAVAAILGGS